MGTISRSSSPCSIVMLSPKRRFSPPRSPAGYANSVDFSLGSLLSQGRPLGRERQRIARRIAAMARTMPARSSPLKHWTGWLPIAISVFLLLLALRYVAAYGPLRQADEGSEAHLFQLLMPVQLAVMAYFALTWLPRAPRGTLAVLGLQAVAAAAVFATVYWIEHSAPMI